MDFNRDKFYPLLLSLFVTLAIACEDIEDVESLDDQGSMEERLTGDGVHQTNGYKSVGMINWCTGTLINGYTVLTAAHCVPRKNDKKLTFTLGKTKYPVAKWYRHPGYRGTEHNDVGIYILKQKVKNVKPSPVSRTPVRPGQRIVLVGMGSTGGNGNYWMTEKYVGRNTVHRVTSQWFSYKGDARNCSGDSGGPAFVGKAIVGLVSTGDGNNCSRSIGYNSRVDDAVNWIARRAKGSVQFVGSN